MTETVAIVGSRDYPRLDLVRRYIETLPEDTVIVSGGAKGVDEVAVTWAKWCELSTVEYLPEWEKYGKSAGFRRNELIVQHCDRLVAFHHADSKGTAHSIRLARAAGKPVLVYDSTGAIVE